MRRPPATFVLAVVAISFVACTREKERTDPLVPETSPSAMTAPSAPVTLARVPHAPSAPGPVTPPSAGPSVALHFTSAPDDLELGAFVRSERLRQKAASRLFVLYVGAPWCPPCRRFHAAAHGGQLDSTLSRITLLELDADRDGDRLATLGYMFKNIPYFAVPGENGKATKALAVSDMSVSAQKQIVDTLTLWQTELLPP